MGPSTPELRAPSVKEDISKTDDRSSIPVVCASLIHIRNERLIERREIMWVYDDRWDRRTCPKYFGASMPVESKANDAYGISPNPHAFTCESVEKNKNIFRLGGKNRCPYH